MDAQHGRWQSIWRKSFMAITQECCKLYWTSPRGNTPQNSSSMAAYCPSQKPFKVDKPDMQDIAGEVRMNSSVMYSYGPLQMDEQRSDDQQEPIGRSSVLIQDVACKTCWDRWTIGMNGEIGLGRFVLAAWHNDDEY